MWLRVLRLGGIALLSFSCFFTLVIRCLTQPHSSPPSSISGWWWVSFFLAALGLSCGLQDLSSWLWHVGSLVVACKLSVAACGISFPDQGSNLGPLNWERGVLATRPLGKSLLMSSLTILLPFQRKDSNSKKSLKLNVHQLDFNKSKSITSHLQPP